MSQRSNLLVLIGSLMAVSAIALGVTPRADARDSAPRATITVVKAFDIPSGNDQGAGNQTARIRGWNTALGTLDEVHITITGRPTSPLRSRTPTR